MTKKEVKLPPRTISPKSKELKKKIKFCKNNHTCDYGWIVETVCNVSKAKRDRRGQYLGAILVAYFGLIVIVLGSMGLEWLAGIMVTTVITPIAVVFVIGKEPKSRDNH